MYQNQLDSRNCYYYNGYLIHFTWTHLHNIPYNIHTDTYSWIWSENTDLFYNKLLKAFQKYYGLFHAFQNDVGGGETMHIYWVNYKIHLEDN